MEEADGRSIKIPLMKGRLMIELDQYDDAISTLETAKRIGEEKIKKNPTFIKHLGMIEMNLFAAETYGRKISPLEGKQKLDVIFNKMIRPWDLVDMSDLFPLPLLLIEEIDKTIDYDLQVPFQYAELQIYRLEQLDKLIFCFYKFNVLHLCNSEIETDKYAAEIEKQTKEFSTLSENSTFDIAQALRKQRDALLDQMRSEGILPDDFQGYNRVDDHAKESKSDHDDDDNDNDDDDRQKRE